MVIACASLLSACGQANPRSGLVVAGATTPLAKVYDGPLYVPVRHPDAADVLERSGAAGRALECDGNPYLGSTGRNWGAPAGGDNPAEGLQLFVEDIATDLPKDGYRIERQGEERVLYSYDVDGETKVAVVVRDGLAHYGEEPGWGMESYAQCNPAEFDPADDQELEHQIWTDQSGDRVPTTLLTSYAGPEHCGWQSVTFLQLRKTQYVRDPSGVLGREGVHRSYSADAQLPGTAVDTGYRLGEKHLWLSHDKATAYVVTPKSTERWPAATKPILCA